MTIANEPTLASNPEIMAVMSTYVTTRKLAEEWGLFPELREYPLHQQETVKAQIVHTLCMMLKESGND